MQLAFTNAVTDEARGGTVAAAVSCRRDTHA